MSKSPAATPLPPNYIERAEVVLETAPPPADVEVPPAPTLITEQEVIFSTAAAVSPAPTRRRQRTTRVVAVAMRRLLAVSSPDSRPRRQHRPPRDGFLEDSRMEREMHRL